MIPIGLHAWEVVLDLAIVGPHCKNRGFAVLLMITAAEFAQSSSPRGICAVCEMPCHPVVHTVVPLSMGWEEGSLERLSSQVWHPSVSQIARSDIDSMPAAKSGRVYHRLINPNERVRPSNSSNQENSESHHVVFLFSLGSC